ncbi:MAG: hypothetical protein PHE84_01745 [bacterium]|nr:hypothetical protein [bacterium]
MIHKVIMTALEIKDRDRLNDIEIGKLVGFSYDETSRWKYGKIKVESPEKLMLINEKVGISEYLLLRVATGRMDSALAFRIWKLGYELMSKYKKDYLIEYLNTQKIDFKLVIIRGEKTP